MRANEKTIRLFMFLANNGGDMKRINWDKRQADFEKLTPGSHLISEDNRLYLKPEQSGSHHLDGMVISLHDGTIHHFSKLGDIKEAFK